MWLVASIVLILETQEENLVVWVNVEHLVSSWTQVIAEVYPRAISSAIVGGYEMIHCTTVKFEPRGCPGETQRKRRVISSGCKPSFNVSLMFVVSRALGYLGQAWCIPSKARLHNHFVTIPTIGSTRLGSQSRGQGCVPIFPIMCYSSRCDTSYSFLSSYLHFLLSTL